ncbi:MAG: energy transducer TonB [Bacteroidia bacterium]|nr:energy transducer TonB [Bacteroidia bacterium]
MKVSTYLQDEAQARRISATLTMLLLLLLFIVAYLWVLVRGTIPPTDENPYMIAGRIDFGYTETPGTIKPQSSPPESPKEEPVITTPDVRPVKTPSTPTPPTAESEPTEESEEEVENEVFEPGGSPDASQPGDIGQGLLEFGEGEEGLQNRRLIHFVPPRYTVQKEARIKFELFVLPNGQVSHARALSLQAPPELKQAGEEAIRQWQFSPITTNQIQRMTVTIRFRLR